MVFLCILSCGATCNAGLKIPQCDRTMDGLPALRQVLGVCRISGRDLSAAELIGNPLGTSHRRPALVHFLDQVSRQNIYLTLTEETGANGHFFPQRDNQTPPISPSQFSKLVLAFFTVSEKKGLVMFHQYLNVTSAEPTFSVFWVGAKRDQCDGL